MERRGFGFFTKRSQHFDNVQQSDNNNQQQQQQTKQPLKDSTNTGTSVKSERNGEENHCSRESESAQSESTSSSNNQQEGRSLQCLETLAQKAGIHDITADDCKYDIANTLLNLDRGHHESHSKQELKHEFSSSNMTDINKNQQQQQQQIVDANAQAQAQAQVQAQAAQAQVQAQAQAQAQAQSQVQVQTQNVQQQQPQIQQVALQPQDQALVPAQSPHLQTVAVSAAQCVQASQAQHTVHQVGQGGQVLQAQAGQVLAPTQSGNTTITTMSPLQHGQPHPQQINADWSHGRAVQVIQQPLQNPTYLQQLYNTSGQLLMPGNIALHPSINPQQIQVITKPFQGNQLAPHMLTTAQGKQVLQASQAASFPGYTTIPTIPTTQNQQTLVFSQLGVISSQPNILPTHSASAAAATISQQKPQEIQKVMGTQKVMQKVTGSGTAVAGTQQQQGQCVQVSQAMIGSQPTAQIISPIQPGGQPMQFAAPWQFANGIPQVWTTNGLQSQALLAPNPIFIRGTQPDGSPGPGMFIQQSPQAAAIQTQQSHALATQTTMQQIGKPRPANENIQPKQPTSRPLNILPSNAANIRPANSISTQSIGTQAQGGMATKQAPKVRAKAPGIRTSPAPKADAANQTQIKPYTTNLQSHHLVTTNKSGTSTPTSQNKPQQSQQQVQQQPQPVLMQQPTLQQQQALQQIHFQQSQQSQHIQPKPLMMQTLQGIQQQQIQVQDRPIMPVVSMSTQPNNQQVSQTLQQTIPCTVQQGLPLQSNLAVTQQPMSMGMQQIHPLTQMAPPGTIIGQIQTAQAGAQVAAQLQQMQPASTQQTIALTLPQQVPLPPTITAVKEEQATSNTMESHTTAVSTQSDLQEEAIKDSADAQSAVKEEMLDVKSSINGIQSMPLLPSSSGIQPAPIPGTALSQPTINVQENGLPIATTAEDIKEKGLPKAMVKPQVLTHVIEDFVIQESSEPFPVTRSSLLSDLKPTQSSTDKQDDIHSRKRRANSPSSNNISPKGEVAKCDGCGVVDLKAKFKKNKRFCSVACSKNQKCKPDEKKAKWSKDELDGELNAESSLSSNDLTSGNEGSDDNKVNPLKWSVSDVCDFIRNLPGCSDYAEDFLIQEIDGQALMLLKEDHLMTAMAMKLGPALKIVAKIDDMRIDKEQPKQ